MHAPTRELTKEERLCEVLGRLDWQSSGTQRYEVQHNGLRFLLLAANEERVRYVETGCESRESYLCIASTVTLTVQDEHGRQLARYADATEQEDRAQAGSLPPVNALYATILRQERERQERTEQAAIEEGKRRLERMLGHEE